MDKIKVVGHRGVRGINVENTVSALKDARRYGVDAVEFDVRLTRDKQLVLCHNRNLKKIYGIDSNVDEMDFTQLEALRAPNGERVPRLQEILDLNIGVPLLMDVKNSGSADLIYQTMNRPKNRHVKWMVTTFLADEAARFKQLDKDLWVSVGTLSHPFGIIKTARRIGADAITMNLLLLDLFNFRSMRRAGFRTMVYMNYVPFLLTTPWIVRILLKFYPGIIICTDRPDRIVPLVKG